MDESAVKRIKSPDALTKGDSTVLAILTILTINIFIHFNLKKSITDLNGRPRFVNFSPVPGHPCFDVPLCVFKYVLKFLVVFQQVDVQHLALTRGNFHESPSHERVP